MSAPIPLRKNPFPNWKWPLTHKERIAELEPLLSDEHWEHNWVNINAAVEWHKEFPRDTLCEYTLVNFQHGRQVEDLSRLTDGTFWTEVDDPRCILFINN